MIFVFGGRVYPTMFILKSLYCLLSRLKDKVFQGSLFVCPYFREFL